MDSNPRSPVRSLTQTRSNGDVQHPPVVAAAFQGGPRRLEMGEVITAEGKAILNHDLEMGITGVYVHVDLLPRMREWLDRLSAHYDSLIAVPATISKVNQSASAGGLGEGGNEDESQEVREEDPGGRTRYGNHAGPGG